MAIIRKVLIGILVISLITFVALFGQLPQLRKTPIGWLQRVLCLHLPNTIKAIDRKTTGGRLSVRGKKLGQYLFFQKNPIVLVCLTAFQSLPNPNVHTGVLTILRSSSSPSSQEVSLYSYTTASNTSQQLYYFPRQSSFSRHTSSPTSPSHTRLIISALKPNIHINTPTTTSSTDPPNHAVPATSPNQPAANTALYATPASPNQTTTAPGSTTASAEGTTAGSSSSWSVSAC